MNAALVRLLWLEYCSMRQFRLPPILFGWGTA
jgi:hypothetical protein